MEDGAWPWVTVVFPSVGPFRNEGSLYMILRLELFDLELAMYDGNVVAYSHASGPWFTTQIDWDRRGGSSLGVFLDYLGISENHLIQFTQQFWENIESYMRNDGLLLREVAKETMESLEGG